MQDTLRLSSGQKSQQRRRRARITSGRTERQEKDVLFKTHAVVKENMGGGNDRLIQRPIST